MGIDLRQLIESDHQDLSRGLESLARPTTPPDEAIEILDGLRLLVTAHAGAEEVVLRGALEHATSPDQLRLLVAQVLAAHRAYARELDAMARLPRELWASRATRLRDMIRQHHWHEHAALLPAIRECLPPQRYQALAREYATERLCLVTQMPCARLARPSSSAAG